MISVIIPVYNADQFVRACVQSVLQQTYCDFEVIIIDDGSTDDSYRICKELTKEDSRICLVRQENAGVSAARNKGLSLATGEYILFVDADDLLPPKAMQQLLDGTKIESELVVGAYESFRWKTGKLFTPIPCVLKRDDIADSFESIADFLHTPWGKLFSRRVITENNISFDPDMPYGEDTKFNLEYCKYVQGIRVITETVYKYRKGGVASSVRYYSNRHEIVRAILDAYFSFFSYCGMTPASVMKNIVKDELYCTVVHHVVNVGYKNACKCTQEMLEELSPYLSPAYVDVSNYPPHMIDCIRGQNAEGLVKAIIKESFIDIARKKCKRICYQIFSKRTK